MCFKRASCRLNADFQGGTFSLTRLIRRRFCKVTCQYCTVSVVRPRPSLSMAFYQFNFPSVCFLFFTSLLLEIYSLFSLSSPFLSLFSLPVTLCFSLFSFNLFILYFYLLVLSPYLYNISFYLLSSVHVLAKIASITSICDDIFVAGLTRSEDYKTSVLSRLSPRTTKYARRGLAFYS
jgi:hypothetical protein